MAETNSSTIDCVFGKDNLCACKNLSTSERFNKRTHILECEKCGINDYVENIGVWCENGKLCGALCGECDEEQK